MNGDYVSNLIQRLERAYPETTHPEAAASVSRMKRAYEEEVRKKKTYASLGIELPRQNPSLPAFFPLSGAFPK